MWKYAEKTQNMHDYMQIKMSYIVSYHIDTNSYNMLPLEFLRLGNIDIKIVRDLTSSSHN